MTKPDKPQGPIVLRQTKLTPELRDELDATSVATLQRIHQDFRIRTEYATGQGYWRDGDRRTFELGPAEANAAGRCVAARLRVRHLEGTPMVDALNAQHPARCGWCEYPVDRLLAALDQATVTSRYIADDVVIWPTKDEKSPYVRSTGRAGSYENPVWQAFWRGATNNTGDLPAMELAENSARRTSMIHRAAQFEEASA